MEQTGNDNEQTVDSLFDGNHGKNLMLRNENATAERTDSYNQAVVLSQKPLPQNRLFQVQINSSRVINFITIYQSFNIRL